VAERQRRSNDGEAPVDGDEVPVILQLEEGKGGCEARLQRGTVAARAELTGGRGTGRRWCYVQKSGGSRDFRWAGVDGKPRGEKGEGVFTRPRGKEMGRGRGGGLGGVSRPYRQRPDGVTDSQWGFYHTVSKSATSSIVEMKS
jgi:hypothetical protein